MGDDQQKGLVRGHEELQLLGEQPQLRSFFRDSWERVLGERMSTTEAIKSKPGTMRNLSQVAAEILFLRNSPIITGEGH